MDDQKIIGARYRLSSRLGEGGMAEVHFGLDVRLCRPVAVKRLRRDLAAEPLARASFEREVRIGGRLSHPNIVSVYDAGTTDDPGTGVAVPYIVLEFVPGQSLQRRMRDGQAMPPKQALEVIGGLLDALAHSHAAGVIHQDVKPGNVMLTPEGGVKLMDFGIARSLDEGPTNPISASEIRGSVRYLAPERLSGGTSDVRSDIYSVGCLLYRLLVGRPPFHGGSVSDILHRQQVEPPRPPSQARPSLGTGFDALVLRALAKDPEDRYPSADAMAAALHGVAAAAGRGEPAPRALVRPVRVGESESAAPSGQPVVRSGVAPLRLPAATPARSLRRQRLAAAGVVAALLPFAGFAVQSVDLGLGQEPDPSTAAALGRPSVPGTAAAATEPSARDGDVPGRGEATLPRLTASSPSATTLPGAYGSAPAAGGPTAAGRRPMDGSSPTSPAVPPAGSPATARQSAGGAAPVRPSAPGAPVQTKDPESRRPQPPARTVEPPAPQSPAEPRPVPPPSAPTTRPVPSPVTPPVTVQPPPPVEQPPAPVRRGKSNRPPKAAKPTRPPKPEGRRAVPEPDEVAESVQPTAAAEAEPG